MQQPSTVYTNNCDQWILFYTSETDGNSYISLTLLTHSYQSRFRVCCHNYSTVDSNGCENDLLISDKQDQPVQPSQSELLRRTACIRAITQYYYDTTTGWKNKGCFCSLRGLVFFMLLSSNQCDCLLHLKHKCCCSLVLPCEDVTYQTFVKMCVLSANCPAGVCVCHVLR